MMLFKITIKLENWIGLIDEIVISKINYFIFFLFLFYIIYYFIKYLSFVILEFTLTNKKI